MMCPNPKVSVIIPIYNSERFLKESIDSVLNQTYPNIEVIAINDGSTDKSLQILEEYKNKINVINQENMGLAETANTGIRKISGVWLKWLSPDDVLYPNAIEILAEEAKKLPENTILYSNWDIIDENGEIIRNFHESNYNNLNNFEFNVRLLDGQQININTCLIPKSLFEKGCLMQNLDDIATIDYDFFVRSGILYNTNFYLVEKNLIKYRIHQGQASHKNIIKSLNYLNEIREDILSKLDEQTKNRYLVFLKKYSDNKKFDKKTMEIGLKIITKLLPDNISNRMLVFYLNKIRSGR